MRPRQKDEPHPALPEVFPFVGQAERNVRPGSDIGVRTGTKSHRPHRKSDFAAPYIGSVQ